MPVYKHSVTGQEAELTPDYVSVFPPNVWVLVKDEGPNEQRSRELREALDNKVLVEEDDVEPFVAPTPDPDFLEAQRQAVIAFNTAEAEVATLAPEKKKSSKVPQVMEHVASIGDEN